MSKDHNNWREIHKYAIITTELNSIVGKYYDKMPVILEEENENKWLNPDFEAENLLSLLKPFLLIKWRNGKSEMKREIREIIIQNL
jgi:putative SOS response-associated peptidase YedK